MTKPQAQADAPIDAQVVEFLTGLRSHVYASVLRELRAENKPPTYGNYIDALRKIRFEWQRDTSDNTKEKALYIAIITEEIEKLENRLKSAS